MGQFHTADICHHKIHACIMNRKALIVYKSQVLGIRTVHTTNSIAC